MTSRTKTILLLALVTIMAVVGCFAGTLIALRMREGKEVKDGHAGLHQRLKIRDDQHAPMEAIERKFAEQEAELLSDIHTANTKLATALKRDQAYSEDVQSAVDAIHHAQAALQRATIEHLVEMGTVLTPAQFQMLLDDAGDALTQ